MNIPFWKFLYLPALVLLACCTTPADHSINQFSDPVRCKIADLQDKRAADSLYPYFGHENANYRREAVEAFGSLQITENPDRIGKLLLMDADEGVRKAAAFALGQIQHPECERILVGAMVKEKIPEIVFEILQAYGKTTKQWNLDPGSFISDSVKSAGLAWSLYRAGLRGKSNAASNEVAMRLLDRQFSTMTRLGAAHYFARGARDYQDAESKLISSATTDQQPEVRMAAALSLGKISSDSALVALKSIIKTDKDSRVVINAIRALRTFPFEHIKHYLYEALRHKDVNVGVAASEIVLETLTADQWIDVSSLTNEVENWRIAANLYEAALKAGGNKDLAAEIQKRYKAATDPYERASLLASLKHYYPAFEFVLNELQRADTAIVRSTAAATLAALSHSKSVTRQMRSRFAEHYRDIIQSHHDPAVLGIIASTLGDSTLDYNSILHDPSFLYEAKRKLRLPQDNEALQPLEAAIAHFENRKPAAIANDFNHPVDWELVKTIAHDQTATIKTTRGNIVIRLLVNESPGSVANFVTLAKNDYFDRKPVHRVVPNFVIQAGCKRGDGWGSEDYSIRSEFSPRLYKTGSVGMASAGKDTEGTQWFITHSPAPHLDGRYTIFAEVIEGMRVVNYLQIGDKITDVVIENSRPR